MILVFGGTTEGRRAVEVLEEAGSLYYYSTKTDEQEIHMHHGIHLVGVLVREAMLDICEKQSIRLIIDADYCRCCRVIGYSCYQIRAYLSSP